MRNGQVFTFRVILHDLVRTYDKIYFIVFFFVMYLHVGAMRLDTNLDSE